MARGPVLVAVCAVALLAGTSMLLLRNGDSTSLETDRVARGRVIALEREIAALRAEVERLLAESKQAFVAERTVDLAAERATGLAADVATDAGGV